MELTKSQLNYIIAINKLTGGKVTQKYICEYLGVKKPSASTALKNLEETGYIKKIEMMAGNNYTLTEKGYGIIKEIEGEKLEFMTLFNEKLNISEDLCLKEYQNLCGYFSPDFIKAISNYRETEQTGIANNNTPNQYMGIKYGEYELPFQVIQTTENNRSMGDKGFEHPAKLVVKEDLSYIVLTSKEIYYKSKTGQILKGSLQALYYYNTDLKWLSSEKVGENQWLIPLKDVLYQTDDFGKALIGIMKIKVSATTMKMPESVAEITFNFKLIKNIKNQKSILTN